MTTPNITPSDRDTIRQTLDRLDAIEVDVTAVRTDLAATRHSLRLALGLVGNQRSPYAPPTISDLEDDR